jgi:glutamyl-tRNA(Gln) amidotransferase subunit E
VKGIFVELDYKKIGLKVGLEIHQQLKTNEKLFCSCKPELFKEEPELTFLRQLRPTQSELGQVDPAAYFEFQKGIKILYEANTATSCLVEMDEEPPHLLNTEAVEVVLATALMMKASPVDEVHVMRKSVIDGSNTTGFQRTCIIAHDGEIEVSGKKIQIQHISLEEDAARKTGEKGRNTARYRIDRLGIPLIEVATAPVIFSPQEAQEAALEIGRILRATHKVMRGLGTIRQDLNISILGGALIEIKGMQELELISTAVENEVKRQLNLIKIRDDLQNAASNEKDTENETVDVTNIFDETKCKVIREAIDQNRRVLAVKLRGFNGYLRRELLPDFRLGTEMADHARFWGRVGGIFHTDELPAYGITMGEVQTLRKMLKAEQVDAVVFVADEPENATDALKAVVNRADEAKKGVPEETRAAKSDGKTRYMRPRPGSARMYPETDIPVTEITLQRIDTIRTHLPEMPEHKKKRIIKQYDLNEKLAKQVIDSEYGDLFETTVQESGVPPTTIAVFLTETLKALRREGFDPEKISETKISEIFESVGSGELAKEAIQNIASWLIQNENRSVQEAVEKLGYKMLSEDEIERIVDSAIAANVSLVKERGMKASGAIMSIVMKEVRGKAQPETVQRVISKKLQKRYV